MKNYENAYQLALEVWSQLSEFSQYAKGNEKQAFQETLDKIHKIIEEYNESTKGKLSEEELLFQKAHLLTRVLDEVEDVYGIVTKSSLSESVYAPLVKLIDVIRKDPLKTKLNDFLNYLLETYYGVSEEQAEKIGVAPQEILNAMATEERSLLAKLSDERRKEQLALSGEFIFAANEAYIPREVLGEKGLGELQEFTFLTKDTVKNVSKGEFDEKAIASLSGAGLLYILNVMMMHKVNDPTTIQLFQETWKTGKHNTGMMTRNPINDTYVKSKLVPDTLKEHKNPTWEKSYEQSYVGKRGFFAVSTTEHIFIVLPEMTKVSKSKGNNIFFYTLNQAEEFIKIAKLHPYWYDNERGWNLDGWSHLMDGKDKAVQTIENLISDYIEQKGFISKRFLGEAKLDALQSLINLTDKVREAGDHEEALAIIRSEFKKIGDQIENKDTSVLYRLMGSYLDDIEKMFRVEAKKPKEERAEKIMKLE